MGLRQWETIIQGIVDEIHHEPKESGKHKVLVRWRVKLEKEPPHLALFQIDEIVREVRGRLDKASRENRSGVQAVEIQHEAESRSPHHGHLQPQSDGVCHHVLPLI